MTKVLKILVFCFPVLWTNLLSQDITQEVLVPLGSVGSGNNTYYSQTVGETAVVVTGCSFYILTQGFQQPSFRQFTNDHIDKSGVKIYPNPVTDYVNIEMWGDESRIFRIEFLDINGRVVLSEKKCFGDQYWYRQPYNVKEMVSGLYMIRIMSEDGLFNRTFRIQKI